MTIEEMNKKLDELKDNIENALSEVAKYEELIRQIKAQEEPKFERRKGREYFMVGEHNGKAECYRMEDNIPSDQLYYDNNNYFYTDERAQKVADKINFLLKLERFHDIFCPDYVPDWDDFSNKKYEIFYDHDEEMYKKIYCYSAEYHTMVYFPTEEIVQKVCDILNKEREENDERR